MWYPETTNNLFNGSEIIVTGLYEKGQDELYASVNGTTEQGDISHAKIFSIGPDPDDEYISRFWGYSRINHLLDQITVNGEQPDLVNETVELAIKFKFVTKYTSYVSGDAVDEALENLDTNGLLSNSRPPGDSGGATGAAPDDSSGLPGPGFSTIIILVVAVAMLTSSYRKRKKS